MNTTKRLSRRRMLKGSSAALAALGLLVTKGFGKPVSAHASHKEITMNEDTMTQDTRLAIPEGPGSASGAPHRSSRSTSAGSGCRTSPRLGTILAPSPPI